MVRKSYDKQFKMAAVKMIVEDDIPVKTVAKELEVHQNTIYRWLGEYEEYGEDAFPVMEAGYIHISTKSRNYRKKITFSRRNWNC